MRISTGQEMGSGSASLSEQARLVETIQLHVLNSPQNPDTSVVIWLGAGVAVATVSVLPGGSTLILIIPQKHRYDETALSGRMGQMARCARTDAEARECARAAQPETECLMNGIDRKDSG
ncbi:hypothetical protein C8Q69DRAFT_443775 [Paecilomyces variotii]|uniref:Uncharacterized protein n=1 Tax=Byssochlamys spectabilis TaxID=264951 RepID=A0A443HW31_BYSSP|nr:hypothetical protein C8Q69DRAFT_443775 [Paecilomyces variotii]RWQ96036.1 hypothetical protein C8Q69DRAFT_443775 [Paecilomyces variotii]